MESFDTELFIATIQSRPVLWDTRIPEYSNKIPKIKAWEEICDMFYLNFNEKTNTEKNLAGKLFYLCH